MKCPYYNEDCPKCNPMSKEPCQACEGRKKYPLTHTCEEGISAFRAIPIVETDKSKEQKGEHRPAFLVDDKLRKAAKECAEVIERQEKGLPPLEEPPKRSWEEKIREMFNPDSPETSAHYVTMEKDGLIQFIRHTIESVEKEAYERGEDEGFKQAARLIID